MRLTPSLSKKRLMLILGGMFAFVGAALLNGLIIWYILDPVEQKVLLSVLEKKGLIFFLILLICGGIGSFIGSWVFRSGVLSPKQIAEKTTLMLDANKSFRFSNNEEYAQKELTMAINSLADARDELHKNMQEKIQEAAASVEQEKDRLSALMSELNQSVVVCNLDGVILLYNQCARNEFEKITTNGQKWVLGLGRSIYSFFEKAMLLHAIEKISNNLAQKNSRNLTNFVTTTDSGQLLRVQVGAVINTKPPSEQNHNINKLGGLILMLENITEKMEEQRQRDLILKDLTEGNRVALSLIKTSAQNLQSNPQMDFTEQKKHLQLIEQQSTQMAEKINNILIDYADSLKSRWPLEEILGNYLVRGIAHRIENRLGMSCRVSEYHQSSPNQPQELWVAVDSYSILQVMYSLAIRLHEAFSVRYINLRINLDNENPQKIAQIDLLWQGNAISTETFMNWEAESLNMLGINNPLSARDVLDRHGGSLSYKRESASQSSFFRLQLPFVQTAQIAKTNINKNQISSRPEYYDFDLFDWASTSQELETCKLSSLNYTVFDTETSGLVPSNDEIIQIGAVRVVNGRLLKNEYFDELIDPKKTLSAENIAIHGITQEMVLGKLTIDKVLPMFYIFCQDTVLVAHNAAFDMRFLQIKESKTGIKFTQPVIDTLVISEIVHPHQENHRLETIAKRLGIEVRGRHTALGDAIVTGEVFVRMLPLLAEKGISTLGQLHEASAKTYYAKIKY